MPGKNILWLCSWYPNRLEPFNGDFIQRHARAAALYNNIHVIHLAVDISGKTATKETTIKQEADLTEQIIYYKKKNTAWGRFRAHYRWLFLYRQALRNYILINGKPDLVHIQVPLKAGLFGIWMKRKYRIPYVVTEHWGIYNDVVADRFANRNRTFQYYTRQIFSKAAKFISVSRYLGEGVNRLVLKKEYQVIPNVVDTSRFFYTEKQSSRFRFIHVSNMVPLKNCEGILRAFSNLFGQNSDTELVMVGDTDPSIREYAASFGLPADTISFRGEVSYQQVAIEMQQADCLILFSNIENSPCVIGEALCCGLPVIATNVGGIPELVNESNSILVEAKNEDQLMLAMQQAINSYSKFDRKAIAEKAALFFSYDGRQN
jgi:glycosyltransferase involved in cell wall biosynthesis